MIRSLKPSRFLVMSLISLGLVAVVGQFASAADPISDTDSAIVTLTIEKYCYVDIKRDVSLVVSSDRLGVAVGNPPGSGTKKVSVTDAPMIDCGANFPAKLRVISSITLYRVGGPETQDVDCDLDFQSGTKDSYTCGLYNCIDVDAGDHFEEYKLAVTFSRKNGDFKIEELVAGTYKSQTPPDLTVEILPR